MKIRTSVVAAFSALTTASALGAAIVYQSPLRTVETQVVDPNVVNASDTNTTTGLWARTVGGYGPNGGNEAIAFQLSTLGVESITSDGFWASADLSRGSLGVIVGSAWARTSLDVTFTLAESTDFVLAYLPPLVGPGGSPTLPGLLKLMGNGVDLTLNSISSTAGTLAPGEYRLQALAEATADAAGAMFNRAWFGFVFVVPTPGSAVLLAAGAGIVLANTRRRRARS